MSARNNGDTVREIPRKPQVPVLTDKVIALLAELCFRQDDRVEGNIDTVFVFSALTSMNQLAEKILTTSHAVRPQRLIIAGGTPHYNDGAFIKVSEADKLYHLIHKALPTTVNVCLERNSNNFLENVVNSLALIDPRQAKKVLFIAQNYAAGRAYLTLKKYLPHAQLFQAAYRPWYAADFGPMDKDTWHKDPSAQARVFGEYLRIQHYGARGDINFEEVAGLSEQIWQALSREEHGNKPQAFEPRATRYTFHV